MCADFFPLSRRRLRYFVFSALDFGECIYFHDKIYQNLRELSLLSLYVVRRGGLMVCRALDSGSSGLGSSPNQGHCVVFLGKTRDSCSASLHPRAQMGTDECWE